MADDDERAGPAVEEVLELLEGVDVEVVGGLVEQQDVGLGHQQAHQLQAPALAAGEVGDRRPLAGRGEAEALGELRGGLLVAPDRHPLGDVLDGLQDPPVQRQVGEVLRAGGRGARSCPGRAARRRARARRPSGPQQRRLARAVDPDDADAVAGADAPGLAVDQRPVADGERRVLELERPCARGGAWPSSRARRCRAAAGTSAMSASAASTRYCGFDVRACGPRRSHASSLRARLRRRCSAASASRARSARAKIQSP